MKKSVRMEIFMNDYCYIARIRIQKKDSEIREYLGRGVADLLHGVEKYHSLNLAAREMGMAYSKAWRIVRDAETAMGMTFLYRMRRNGSELTEEGKKLLSVYEEAEREAWKAVDRVIEKYYGETEKESGGGVSRVNVQIFPNKIILILSLYKACKSTFWSKYFLKKKGERKDAKKKGFKVTRGYGCSWTGVGAGTDDKCGGEHGISQPG